MIDAGPFGTILQSMWKSWSALHDVQVLTAVEEFAVVRDRLQELGQQIDHDHSGLVYTPLTHVEVPSTFP